MKQKPKPPAAKAVPKYECDGCKMLRACGVKDTSKCDWCAARRGEPSPERARAQERERRAAMDARVNAAMLKDVNGGVRVWDKRYGETLRRWKGEVEAALAAGAQPPPWRWENTFEVVGAESCRTQTASPNMKAMPKPPPAAKPKIDLVDAWGYKLGTRQARVNHALADSGKWASAAFWAKKAKCPADVTESHLKALLKQRRAGLRMRDGQRQYRVSAAFE